MFKRGFTLAEVLITMAIIGVVATMTIPSLSNSYQKKVLTTQLQKAYAEISQAAAMVMADEMATDFKETKTMKNTYDFIGKYLKATEISINKFPKKYKLDSGTDNYDFTSEVKNRRYKCGQLKMGAYVCFCKTDYDWHGQGILDTNGEKGPNQIGQDAFSIGFAKDGSIDPDYSWSLESIIDEGWDIDKYDSWRW